MFFFERKNQHQCRIDGKYVYTLLTYKNMYINDSKDAVTLYYRTEDDAG